MEASFEVQRHSIDCHGLGDRRDTNNRDALGNIGYGAEPAVRGHSVIRPRDKVQLIPPISIPGGTFNVAASRGLAGPG